MSDFEQEAVGDLEVVEATTEVSHEQIAMEKGWRPQEEFTGKAGEWRPAKEWLERGELLDNIHKQNKKVKTLEDSITKLLDQQSKIQEQAYNKALKDLQKNRREAASMGDVDQVERLTQEEFQLRQNLPVDNSSTIMKTKAESFQARNADWFNQDGAENAAMRAFAIAKEQELLVHRPNAAYDDVLEMVEKEVKKTFKHRFESEQTSKPAAVSGGRSGSVTRAKLGFNDLPEDHKSIVKGLQNVMGKRFDLGKYINDLKAIGAI